jgi:hypothetical protein
VTAQVQAGHQVVLSGTVTGSQVAGATVMFSGAAMGMTMTDSNGNYTYTTTSASLGTVTASRLNQSWQTVASAQATIAVAAPSLTLSIAYGSNRTVTLSGKLTDIDAGGRFINISGAGLAMPMTDSNGNFSYTTSTINLGTVNATETDAWGQTSNTAHVTVSSNGPEIADFIATHGFGCVWTFSGRVIDENAEGLTIRFGGLMSLLGLTTAVHEDGTFSFTRTLAQGEFGTATAVTTDWWGQDSDVEWAAVL